MKCIAAVVMMALAVVAEAGFTPVFYGAAVAYPGHTTVVQGNQADPKKITEFPAITYSAPAITTYSSFPASYPAFYPYAAPLTYAAAIPAPIAPAVVYQKEARYLAATPGAVHEAPLVGHEVSQQSLNLEPAAEAN